MSIGRMWMLASVAFLCLNHQASAQQQSQRGRANPHVWRTENANAPYDPLYQWVTSGNAHSWYQVPNQYMGMSLTPADDALRAHLKLPKDHGLIVTSLDVHSPAALAGIQQNDILLDVENAPLGKPEDLEIGLKAAGDKRAPLTILRSGKKLTIQVQPRVSVTMAPVQPEPPPFWIGVSVAPIEPALRAQLNIPENQGLLVIDVTKDSPASQAEIKVHDILLTLSGQPLSGQDKLVEIVQAFGEKPIVGKLIRDGKTQTYEVTPMRRKSDQFNVYVNDPRTFAFQVIRPGAMTAYEETLRLSAQPELMITNRSATPALTPAQPSSGDAGISKRLDDLDAEIKQLRKAIEELSKALANKK